MYDQFIIDYNHSMFTVKGVLLDFDEEWLMLEVKEKKTSSTKMFRINNISSIKEIRE